MTAAANFTPGAGRYAPSPSGNLHLGNLRTALVAWLAARSTGRRFVLRVDDLDRARDAGYAAAQLQQLASLGLTHDGEIVYQSNRTAHYAAALAELTAANLTYECVCSRKDILAAPTAPHAPPGAYPGTCRNLDPAQKAAALAAIAPRQPAIRLRTPVTAGTFTDQILGEQSAGIDDFVLRRGDGTYAYNLATVVDDAAAGVDQIVRGADLASSTPRQILLGQLLGLPQPSYAHVPLVLNPAGARLAKRDGAVTLVDLAAQGLTSEQVLQVLAQSLNLAHPGETVTAADLVPRFSLQQLPRQAWVVDPPALFKPAA